MGNRWRGFFYFAPFCMRAFYLALFAGMADGGGFMPAFFCFVVTFLVAAWLSGSIMVVGGHRYFGDMADLADERSAYAGRIGVGVGRENYNGLDCNQRRQSH
jgi:hypothetical protein